MTRTQIVGIGLVVTAALAGVWAVQSHPGNPTSRPGATTADLAVTPAARTPAAADRRPADLGSVLADAASNADLPDDEPPTDADADDSPDPPDLAPLIREIRPGCFAWSPIHNSAACMTGHFSKQGPDHLATYSLNVGDDANKELAVPFDNEQSEHVLVLKGDQVTHLNTELAEGQYDEFRDMVGTGISPRMTADLLIRNGDEPPIAWLRVRWSQMLSSHNEDATSGWNDYQSRLSVRCLPPDLAVKSPELVLGKEVETKNVPPLPKGVRSFEFDLDQDSGADQLRAGLSVMPGGRYLVVEVTHYRELEGEHRGSNEVSAIDLADKCPRALFRLPKVPATAVSPAAKAPAAATAATAGKVPSTATVPAAAAASPAGKAPAAATAPPRGAAPPAHP